VDSYLPSTKFNEKVFDYLLCNNCQLIYTSPIPTDEDFEKMYPTSCQNGVNTRILENQYKKLIGLRFSYGYQFDLIKRFKPKGVVLDYGCGAANFISNASYQGFNCVGAEYNLSHIEILKKTLPNQFFLIDDVLSGKAGKFDVIRLSNFLEHLPNPIKTMELLLKQLNIDGILLMEGPIETNTNLALLTRKIYFIVRRLITRNWIVEHVPTRMFFSNRKNQREFFYQFDIDEIHFDITEAEWLYPC
jgi:2-polyprenyl-3-methyl-5-hydroxy-6-metoxy-1,4-benzoquinol methylase